MSNPNREDSGAVSVHNPKCVMAQKPFMLNDGTRLVRINIQEVAYLQADRVYCQICMRDGRTHYTLSRPLGEVEKSLPEGEFVRISRSYVINLQMVQMIMGRIVRLDNGEEFTMGEQYKGAFDGRLTVFPQPQK